MKNIFLILFLLSIWQIVEAQSVRRSTLSSVGMISQQNGIRISSSFGQQCVGCSVLQAPSGIGYFRQGYQQPNASLSPCGFSAAIAMEPIETACGTYYSFEFLGNPTSPDIIYQWNFGQNASPSTSNEQNPSMIAFAQTGSMVVSLTATISTICEETVSSNFNIEATAFGAFAGTTRVDCFGDENGAIVIDGFGGEEPYSLIWADDSTTERIRTDLAVGNYSFTITDANNCKFESVAIVEGPTSPISIVQVALVPESCTGTEDGFIEIDIVGGAEGYELNWSNQENTLLIEDLATGDYSVTITDISGCASDTTFTVFNICEDGEDFLYDVITPNDDGVNDYWNIQGIENSPNNRVEIFNRWGEIVWKVSGYINNDNNLSFHGVSSSGKELPTGAYYFIIQYNDTAKTIHGGAVTVIR